MNSGIIYFAREEASRQYDPLRSYFDELQKNEIYFLGIALYKQFLNAQKVDIHLQA